MKHTSSIKWKHYLIYTFLFIICCLGVFYGFYSSGKSLIYEADGWTQHYKSLIYYSRYLKEILKSLINNHKLIIPQFDFSIGEGSDILGTFHYYVIGDPIAFLSVFVKEEYIYLFFNYSVILRLYLAGIAFICFCHHKEKNNTVAIVAGSLTYVFCFWNFFNGSRHIYFLNPMIYLPFVIMGTDKIINNDKPIIFVISVCISALSNFYFFYNIVIITVIYVAVKLLIIYKNDIKSTIIKVSKLFKYSIIAVLISAIILLPIIYVFLSDTRSNVDFDKALIYPIFYYLKLPSTLLSTSTNSYLYMGFASPIILAFICNAKNIKKYKFTFILEIISIAFICIPILGQIMNGNTYIANKWSFCLALLFAYNLVNCWDDIKLINKYISILLIVLSVGCLVIKNINLFIPLLLSGLFLIIIKLNIKQIIQSILLVALIVINVCFNANWHYTELGSNYLAVATTFDEDKNVFTYGPSYTISKYLTDEDEFIRYSGNNLNLNESILFNNYSTTYFWSLSNISTSNYRNQLELNEYSLYSYKEYDKRSLLYTLANVKYYLTNKDDINVPYGFSFDTTIDDIDIYINKNDIPFGYTYNKAISYTQWDNLSIVDKENVLSEYVVLNKDINNKDIQNNESIDYELDFTDGIKIDDSKIIVEDTNGKLILKYNNNNEKLLYFEIKGLEYDSKINWLKRNNASKERSSITISNTLNTRELATYSSFDRMHNGREDFVINMNTSSTPLIEISFTETGVYYFDEINLFEIDPSYNDSNINALKQETLQDVVFDTNKVSGNITLSQDKYLLLSIPYSKGWKAYVDGQETELLNGNVAYCALELSKGYHDIELRYSTPLLKEGAILSLVGIALLVIEIKKKNEKKN